MEKNSSEQKETKMWDTEKDIEKKAARLQESILRTHISISFQFEMHKSSLKYTPFNFSPSVLGNCKKIHIDEVK